VEILSVLGFFLMLLVTGVSLLGVIAALVAATALMFAGGLLAIVIKVLPWLVLAVIAVWLYRAFFINGNQRQLRKLKRKINKLDRNGWR
jgi:phage shock protein G